MPESKFKTWVNREVAKELDREPFSCLPLKTRAGIFLLVGSFVYGYGVPVLLVVLAGMNKQLFAGILGGSFVYISSWVMGAVGLALAGMDCVKYPVYFFAKFLKMLFPRRFRQPGSAEVRPPSMFAIVTFTGIIAIVAVVIVSLQMSSAVLFAAGAGTAVVIHQSLYIYGMFSTRSNFFFKTVKGKEFFQGGKDFLLRFDDGPDPDYTPRILDVLRAEGLRAMFAVMGSRAEQYPEIIERMRREGHIIANHTYTHPFNILLMGYRKVFDEIKKCGDAVEKITGERPVYFCPTIGHKNPAMGRAARNLGLTPVMWDLRTVDTQWPAGKIIARVRRRLKPPAIILFHDGVLPLSRQDRDGTLRALAETIRIMKERKRND